MLKTARVITTWDCNRNCDKCCNKNLPAEPIPCTLRDLPGFDGVVLTGGEPLLYPEKLLDIVRALRTARWIDKSDQKIFLYTALWTPHLWDLVGKLDGIHYTLHYPASDSDLIGFEHFQNLLREYQGSEKSFRLYLEPRITEPILLYPNLWSRVEVKPWLDFCPLPENETLFVLR
jgi:hypothetical protein